VDEFGRFTRHGASNPIPDYAALDPGYAENRVLFFAAPSRRSFTYGISDDLRQIADEAIERLRHPTDLLGDTVDLALNAIKARLYSGQIVSVAPGLFQNVTRDELFALDFAFERLEFFFGDVRRHCLIP
jgi:hypothetical protein